MLHNFLRRKQNRLDLIGVIILGVVVCVFVIGVCFALSAGAYDFVSSGRIAWLGLLFWAIFLWWQLLPIMVAGFGASFDFRTMLRFPLSFAAFYIIGVAYGLADFTGVAAVCWIIAVIFGVGAANLTLLPALLLMSVLFIALNVALERLVGSWMERLMAGRRTRELFFAGFILLMLALQLVGPLLNRYGDSAEPLFMRALPYLSYFPASLVGKGVEAAAAGNYGGIAVSAAPAGCFPAVFCCPFLVARASP